MILPFWVMSETLEFLGKFKCSEMNIKSTVLRGFQKVFDQEGWELLGKKSRQSREVTRQWGCCPPVVNRQQEIRRRSAYPVLRIAHWISLRGINYVRISTDTTFSPTQFESLFQYMHEKKMHVIFKKSLVRLRCIECLASLQAGEHRVWRWDNDLISLCYSVFVCQLGKTPVHLAGLLRRVLGGGPGTWWDPVTGNCRVLKVGYIRGRMRILEFF